MFLFRTNNLRNLYGLSRSYDHRSIAIVPQFVKTGAQTGVNAVGAVVGGVASVTGSVAGAVVDGVTTVTTAVGDAKDQIIATGIIQNVNTLNAVKRQLHLRGEPDNVTIALDVNIGVAKVTLTTTYTPKPKPPLE